MICYDTILALIISSFIFPPINGLQSENVVGGKRAEIGQFEYQAAILCLGVDICGGALIDPRFILTAAHCMFISECDILTNQIKVVVGIIEANDSSDSRVEVGVKYAYVHKKYDVLTFWDYDIAVLELVESINFNVYPHIGPVQFATGTDTWDGKHGEIAGFGWDWVDVSTDPRTKRLRENGGNKENYLNYVTVEVLQNSVCRRLHPSNENIRKIHLCGRTIKNIDVKTEGVCVGDSGSALVVNHTAIGILNTTPFGCDDQLLGSMYSRVSAFEEFITDAIENHGRNRAKIFTIPEKLHFYRNKQITDSPIHACQRGAPALHDVTNSIDKMTIQDTQID